MKIFKKITDMQRFSKGELCAGKTRALVPTMGFLHEGHLSLIDIAREKADSVTVSIFVNPSQFGPAEDFDQYPRAPLKDLELCRSKRVDAVFIPETEDMYPENTSTRVSEEFLSKTLCGISRPGHFQGVTTVVAKLFNAALPDIAVFGRKDAQQALIIKRIVRDLNFPVEIIIAPIIRESDGLAMSSRNKYLSKDERERALSISRSLKKGVSFVKNGSVKSPGELINLITAEIASAQGRIDYVEVVRMTDLRPAEDFRAPCLVAAAAFFGNTRLIDNETIE